MRAAPVEKASFCARALEQSYAPISHPNRPLSLCELSLQRAHLAQLTIITHSGPNAALLSLLRAEKQPHTGAVGPHRKSTHNARARAHTRTQRAAPFTSDGWSAPLGTAGSSASSLVAHRAAPIRAHLAGSSLLGVLQASLVEGAVTGAAKRVRKRSCGCLLHRLRRFNWRARAA